MFKEYGVRVDIIFTVNSNVAAIIFSIINVTQQANKII